MSMPRPQLTPHAMAAEHVPTVDEVLNKLKYNGTFDYFRKTCLESIEAEVRSVHLW